MEKMWAGQTAPFFCPLNADYALANSIMRHLLVYAFPL
jgi:hypothetical protein